MKLLGELRERKAELLPLFQLGPGESVTIGSLTVPYSVWTAPIGSSPGQPELGPVFVLDTETTLIQGVEIPDCVLATAFDGQQAVLIHADDLQPRSSSSTRTVRSVATMPRSITGSSSSSCDGRRTRGPGWKPWTPGGGSSTRADCETACCWTAATGWRSATSSRNLADWTSWRETTADYRSARTIRSDSAMARSVTSHGIRFHAATSTTRCETRSPRFDVYSELIRRCRKVCDDYGISSDLVRDFGCLTEQIQVCAAIALADVERNGLHIDVPYLGRIRDELKQHQAQLLEWLDEEVPGLLKRNKSGQLKLSKKTAAPGKNNNVLLPILERIAQGRMWIHPGQEKGQISTSSEFWQDFRDQEPFIGVWLDLESTNKNLQFFRQLSKGRIHPRYSVMVRTGRTSSHGPNIQQLPRTGHVREGIIAPPGHSLLAIDYSYVELRTLAAVCEARYGNSKLGEIIRQGTDPHCYTAALFEGVPLDQFLSWKENDPERYGSLRQRAKSLNFGLPGGLGVATLVKYAKVTYGVELSVEDAKTFRNKLINEVYPELQTYLSEDSWSVVARQLHCEAQQVRELFPRADIWEQQGGSSPDSQ